MGNTYSVTHEEEKEALYRRLADAVAERRERQERARLADLEAGLHRSASTSDSGHGTLAFSWLICRVDILSVHERCLSTERPCSWPSLAIP